jgi:hypothetical protein
VPMGRSRRSVRDVGEGLADTEMTVANGSPYGVVRTASPAASGTAPSWEAAGAQYDLR